MLEVKAFYDPATFTVSFVAYDPSGGDAVIIDPVLDFDPLTWRTSRAQAKQIMDFVGEKSLKVRWILDTHAHADHLSGMDVLKHQLGAPTAIGSHIRAVQDVFTGLYNVDDVPADGSQWDELLEDNQELDAGSFRIKALHTPGHTPACMSYLINDVVFTGDALFMPDYGTGRCDFPRGSAEKLYESITTKLYTLPRSTRVMVGHDYQPGGRPVAWETTIGASMDGNKQLRSETARQEFVDFRQARDKGLAPPKLILQSLQVNIRAGALPEPEPNGQVYFKIPVNFLGP